jgi:hypothetical protein
MTGRDFRTLSERRQKGGLADVLKSCWVSTTDHGPYGNFTWAKAYMGDVVAGLIAVRVASFPPPDHLYAFDLPCQHCGARIKWELDLADLPHKAITPETRERVASGVNAFQGVVGGVPFTFRLMQQGDEQQAGRRGERERDVVTALSRRILSVEGVEPGKDPQLAHLAWLEGLGAAEIRDILAVMEAADFGVETSIDVVCERCNAEQEVPLPFGPAFFLPRKS